ncbi:energy transducer TonB [uncultured Ilyobacter sp.]|uniref:energy transducer TonB n=1 Tax=uncultured Ilyobacter sp. TaxID=544433 RepID=UPI0029F57E3E|nr:energy transducer TonB [uncultured Ilyobacter sp.]
MKNLVISVFLHITILYTVVLMNSNRVNIDTLGDKVSVNIVNIVSKQNPSTGNKKSVKKIKKGNRENIVPKGDFTQKNAETTKKKEQTYKNEKKQTEQIKSEKKTSENPVESQQSKELSHGKADGNSDKDVTVEIKTDTDENKIADSSNEIGEGFDKLSDGSIVAKNQGVPGLKYGFISNPDPEYPVIAKKLGFGGEILVKVRMLVDEDGSIEEIKFYSEKDKFGFSEEVRKTLTNWKLTPVKVGDKNIKMYLFKTFRFKLKS